MKMLWMGLVAVAVSGCATWGPTWSEFSGERYNRGILNRRPAFIQTIDGSSAFPTKPIKVEPGKHVVELAAPTPGWPGGGPLKTITIDAEPCKLYYINAQFDNAVQPNWTPVIDYVDTIVGCTVPTGAK